MLTHPAGQDAANVDGALLRLVDTVRGARDELRALLDRHAPGAAQHDALSAWLYTHWYTCPPAGRGAAPIAPGRRDLVPALHAALAASGSWETGWVALETLPGNACVAGRGKLARFVACGDYANVSRPGVPVAPGDGLAVLDRLDWVDEPTGFWCARSVEAEPEPPHKRVYWSVAWDAAAGLLRRLVPVLDAARRPWSLKCPSQAADFVRSDSLVLYVARADWPLFEPQLRALVPQVAACLRDGVPPLTLPIGTGVAVADSPPAPLSFGQARCLALATGVRVLVERADIVVHEALALLRQSLQAQRIDPARPWAGD